MNQRFIPPVYGIIGDAGKRLHTGRSRNDQVATDIRLYLRAAINSIQGQLRRLRAGLIDQAETYADTVMPGFTHLQVAQPVTFGHHLLAWNEMLARDDGRLTDCAERMNQCPLGAAALAGTSYPINRQMTAEALGFTAPTENSLDSVSDRDFAIEFTAAAAITMMHLSRMAEEMIIWTSAQFAFVDLPDRFCTDYSSLDLRFRNYRKSKRRGLLFFHAFQNTLRTQPYLVAYHRLVAYWKVIEFIKFRQFHLLTLANAVHGLPCAYHRGFGCTSTLLFIDVNPLAFRNNDLVGPIIKLKECRCR